MRKAIVGLAAVGSGVGLLLAARRVSHQFREHAKQMKAHCEQMMAARNGSSELPSEREVGRTRYSSVSP